MLRRLTLVVMAMMVLIIVAACAQPAPVGQPAAPAEEKPAAPAAPTTLIIARNTQDAVSLDSGRAYEFTSTWVVNQAYDTLVGFDPGDYSDVKPRLATEWSVSDDGLTWTFKLREGVKFHSGNELTAEDVVWSLRRVIILEQTASWVLTQFVSNPDNIQATGKYEVQITTDEPVAELLFMSTLAFTTGSILDKQAVLEHEQDGDMGAEWLTDHTAGSGPFILESWTRNNEFVLNAFKDYWRGAPGVDRLIIKDMPEPEPQKLALEKGEVDIAWDLLPDQIVDLAGSPDISIQESPTFFIWYIGMNVGKVEAFADNRVRNAVRYAIDYDAIVDDLMSGGAVKGQTFVPKGMFGHLDATPYTRDVEKARSLMEEAGYADGFQVEMITSPASPWPDIAALIKSNLADIGIDVQIKQVQGAQLYEIYRAQDHQMVLAQWGADYADPDALAKPFAHARTTGPDAKIKQLAWRNMYTNAKTSDMVEQAAAELDKAKREQLYKEIQQIILEEGPFAIFLYPVDRIAYRNHVKNFSVEPLWYTYDLSGVTIEE